MILRSGFLITGIFLISMVVLAFPFDNKNDEIINPPGKTISDSLSTHLLVASYNSSTKIAASTVKAVVVKSWNSSGSELIWPYINENWWKYGSIEVTIDDTNLIDVESFTLQDLINNNADVVIISDPSGGGNQYSESEYQAIMDYCSSGHNLIGTYLLLSSSSDDNHFLDNRLLAPLFGLNPEAAYSVTSTSPTYYYKEPVNNLFTNIDEPYVSNGYPYTQIPVEGNWITSGFDGAEVVGLTQDTTAVITQYNAGNFLSIYISNMPEYYGDTLDARFLYNAITINYQSAPVNNDENRNPDRFLLEQNFPNPFNPLTTIKYRLHQMSNVTLSIFNQLGENVRTLINEKQPIGNYQVQWDGRNQEGINVSSGIYLYRLKAGSFIQMRKMLLLR
jgi:hypothetical protein